MVCSMDILRYGKGALFLFLLAIGATTAPTSYGQAKQLMTLEEGLRMALERNEAILMSQEGLRSSHQQIREARSDAFPQIDLSVDYDRNWLLPSFIFDIPDSVRQSVTVGTHNNINGVVSLRQVLYNGGKIGAARRVAQLFVDFSREDVRAARHQVMAEVEISFYDHLLAGDLVKVSRLSLERAKANLIQVQSLNRAGRVSDYDLLRAEVRVAQLLPHSSRAQNNLILTQMAFKNTIGMDLDRQMEVVGEFREETSLEMSRLEDIVRTALELRPEMRQVMHRVRMRRKAIEVVQAESRPSVSLQVDGLLQIQSNQFQFERDDARQSWSTGISVEMPLFDGLRTKAQVAQARIALRRAQIESDRLERNIRLEITRSWLELQEAKERIRAQEGTVAQAERGLEIAESRYANGVGTQLEVLDAQLALIQAETEYSQSLRDRAVALVALELASGTIGEPKAKGKR